MDHAQNIKDARRALDSEIESLVARIRMTADAEAEVERRQAAENKQRELVARAIRALEQAHEDAVQANNTPAVVAPTRAAESEGASE